ncbi:molybdopterin oxidoreductase [Photobacterium proteolyticum]|uniref:Molybdopterin oxidoreductase n=2 Tax=Photobacterium proteolyticum TaxID=1903952 RepID=A0A1Q9GLZ9_9GAMM|nr:molybdopterin oxidoreductase [Photobacterium proteolyticum]
MKGLAAAGVSAPIFGSFNLNAAKTQAGAKNWTPSPSDSIKSTCVHCVNFCGIDIQRSDGVIRAIYPDSARKEFYNHGICPKGASGLFNTYNPYRLKKPLKRTNKKKGLDVDPGWVEISWEEAFDTITKKMDKIRREDPAKLIWQHGHGKYLIGDKFPKAFAKAFGTPNLVHRTTTCEAARHVADELTWGYHGFLPDLKQTRLFVNFGGNYFEAEQFSRWFDHASLDAKENGMYSVVVEPRLSVCASKADKWIPVRPGKDIILILGIARELIANQFVDEEFLVQYTNAPILLGEQGEAIKNQNGDYLIWDTVSQSARPFSDDVTPALRGRFKHNDRQVITAFETFANGVSDITPQYVEEVADVPAKQVKQLAQLIGEKAMIGATVVVDGQRKRYRPVALHTFRGLSAKQYGVQNWRAALIIQMIIGSIDAVGGTQLHSAYKQPKYFKPSKAEYPPKRVDLQESVFFPHATHNVAQQVALSILEPDRYGLPYVPEMQIFYATNRPFSTSDTKPQFESLKKTFNVCIDIVMSETACMSDIVLPDMTYLESWHFSPTRYTPYTKHSAIRQPATNAYNLEHDGYSIIWELARRLGILDDYVDQINTRWGLKKYPFKKGKNYTAKEAVELIWKEKTKGKSFESAIEKGFVGKHLAPSEIYWGGIEKVFNGPGKPKMKFYADQLVETMALVRQTVAQHDIKSIDLEKYAVSLSPLPQKEHGFPTPHLEANDYPFYLITFKHMYRNQSGNTSTNPILNALGPDTQENGVVINATIAAKKGIREGDIVVIETRIGKVQGKALLTQGIRPDTVGASYHFGQQSQGLPEYAKKGIWINQVLELHPDVVSGMNSFNDTKCKLYKA